MSYAAVLREQVDKQGTPQDTWRFQLPFPFGVWQVTASLKGLREVHWIEPSDTGQQGTELPEKLQQWKGLLSAYLAGQEGVNRLGNRNVATDRIPIDWEALSGTGFQKRCWLALTTIPYGETRSYGWIAEQVGSPLAVRAVGQANGRNPVPLVIPCHRVIAANGKVAGFMRGREGGTAIKAWLLALEQGTER